MYQAILSALALIAISSLLAATPAKPQKRRSPAKTASSTLAHKRAATTTKGTTSKATTSRATSAKTTGTGSTHHKGKIAHRATPIRYFQQAPTPDRYKEIQQALASKGYFKGDPNGQWGTDSADALKRFQTDQSLMPDGKISSLSLIALGLGPKRLTAKSEPTPVPQGALPGAPATPSLAPASPAPAPAPAAAPPQ